MRISTSNPGIIHDGNTGILPIISRIIKSLDKSNAHSCGLTTHVEVVTWLSSESIIILCDLCSYDKRGKLVIVGRTRS